MFQSFETTANPAQGPARLAALRNVMARDGLDGFFVPRADAHQGEYVAECDARLAWLTGFTGSAGFCLALVDTAGVFIDGRYRNQVRSQVDLGHFTPVHWPEVQPGPWLVDQLPDGGKIGFDPWLHTAGEIEKLEHALGDSFTLVASENLVDQIWEDRPDAPQGHISPQPIEMAGKSHGDKRDALAQTLRDAGHSAAVLTLSDSIAWLLNIRGDDIPHIPIVQGFAILHDTGRVDFFTHPARNRSIGDHLGPEVRIYPDSAFEEGLAALTGPVRVDRATAPVAVSRILERDGVEIAWGDDPCILPKARKNPTEVEGARKAHLRDGVALVEFLTWFDATAPRATLTEIDVVTQLENQRRAGNALLDISFETIAGSGPNGAIMHYRVTEDTNRTLQSGDIMVVDSGGQYRDGTTDITRTLPIGNVGDEEKACFTRVVQGMIAISRARWPKGLAGRDLDALARFPLWVAHQDFNHGTGHGVGSFLSVHEGPQRISRVSDVPLEPGMILSNEPGYYRDGAFGIRIENLIVVQAAEALPGGDADREMLCFETLTFTPIDRRLIMADMLSTDERDWLDAYHAQTFAALEGKVSPSARAWLEQACAPL
ncbi:aminopeptidase P family protein [Aliiroseovarius subalbicans]|uniref:aminopeptidase P family protein n=1 Tax=Aliiroseovarius subalbicans TaxID=2925840 RepID=UPI001F59EBC7|nr:aminopeptidase P family protein [Aliiroseovarius subalbicans]MCI2398621.1 aminopeptidase P family protein [Aliiroseovarius subalbicans]